MGRGRHPLADRFWKFVKKGGLDECWEWQGSRRPSGYGQIGQDYHAEVGRTRPLIAHRVSWELHFGPIPAGLFVLHKCDNPPCVNPNHLFLGTNQDNMSDMRRKGRGYYKLTPEQVREIRKTEKRWGAWTKLARRYGVDKTTICKTYAGQRHKDV